MTEILEARTEMFLDDMGRQYSNRPGFAVVVDRVPSFEGFIWQTNGRGTYYAEQDGWVRFLFHSGEPEQQQGFGGSQYHLNMKDGSLKILKGPWSSNSGAVNAAGFGPCREVTVFEKDARVGYGGYAVTLRKLLEIAAVVQPVDGKGSQLFGCAVAFDGEWYDPVIVKDRVLAGKLLVMCPPAEHVIKWWQNHPPQDRLIQTLDANQANIVRG